MGAIVLGFIVAGIALIGEHAFLLWVGLIGLVVYVVSGWVIARRSR